MPPYLRLRLQVHPVDGPPASSLPAALVRRVLGKALIDAFCPFGEPRCQSSGSAGGRAGRAPGDPRASPLDRCHLADRCPYGVLYAASRSARPPFVLATCAEGGSAGRRLELTLAGPAWRLYAWALAALARACHLGLGRERQRWAMAVVARLRADGSEEPLCGADLTRLPAVLEPDSLGLGLAPLATPEPIEVRFLSPTRLLQAGRLLPDRAPVP